MSLAKSDYRTGASKLFSTRAASYTRAFDPCLWGPLEQKPSGYRGFNVFILLQQISTTCQGSDKNLPEGRLALGPGFGDHCYRQIHLFQHPGLFLYWPLRCLQETNKKGMKGAILPLWSPNASPAVSMPEHRLAPPRSAQQTISAGNSLC